jgi:hypothetical protein
MIWIEHGPDLTPWNVEAALDFFEGGIIEREEALRMSGLDRRTFSQMYVARRRARRGNKR